MRYLKNGGNLTFMHWEVEPSNLEPYIPDGLEIDLFEGKAFVGTIPFQMRNVRPRFLPAVPEFRHFLNSIFALT